MSFSTSWDVNKYKNDFESEEHWELRKRFIETHKEKFPEEKIICLSRVFVNVEFLGCRYPEKAMQLVAELSKGVADEYRERQKGKLKRTFVQASDAASSKIKGSPSQKQTTDNTPKSCLDKPGANVIRYPSFVRAGVVKPEMPSESGEFPGFIIFVNVNTFGVVEACPVNILTHSAQKSTTWNSISFYFPPSKNKSFTERYCEVKFKDKVLSAATGISEKDAKMKASMEGLEKLRKTCYTIQAKCKFYSDNPSVDKTVVKNQREDDKPLPEDNIGYRIMQKMGWTGSGLGKHKQGIEAPVKAASQIMRRAGFGAIKKNQFHSKFRQIFKEYAASNSDNDLVFAPDFSSDERKILHMLAQQCRLKTRSYGKDEERHLVVYKVMSLPAILNMLLESGGENEKYLLIPPEGEKTMQFVQNNGEL